MFTEEEVLAIASHFAYPSAPTAVKELKSGNINATFKLSFADCACILQRINTTVFTDPDSLMRNVGLVTEHIRAGLAAGGLDPARRVLHFIPADNGSLLYRAPDGGCWRSYVFVDGVSAYDSIESADLFREAGFGFGEFQNRLADFPAAELVETIPGFHDTPRRFGVFMDTVKADPAGRAASLSEEIAFFTSRESMMHGVTDRIASGELPLRVTHNDTKLNNVLIDNGTGKAICVIDLDTVMPGTVVFDYGDAVRFGACTAAEDEPDTSKIGLNMELFEAFTEGFVTATAGRLTETEIRLLPLGLKVITCELAMRFLTDYIDGDKYFRVNYEGHNLVRAHAQMKLLTELEAKSDEMDAFIDALLKKL